MLIARAQCAKHVNKLWGAQHRTRDVSVPSPIPLTQVSALLSMQVHEVRCTCMRLYTYRTVPLNPNVPDGNGGICNYISPPPPYTEVAPYGHTTVARYSPLKMEDSLNLSIGAGSSFSGGGGYFLDATTVSIGCVFETRANSPIGQTSSLRVVGGDPGWHNHHDSPVSPHPNLRTSLTENEEMSLTYGHGYSSGTRRSRSVGSSVAVQHVSQPAVNPRLPRQARTRHPSLPPFAAAPFTRRAMEKERMPVQPQTATQRGDFPVAGCLQLPPSQHSSFEDEMYSLSLEANSLQTRPPPSFDEEMRIRSQYAGSLLPRPPPSEYEDVDSLQLRPSPSFEVDIHSQSQDAESFQPRSFPSSESEMHLPPTVANPFQPRPSHPSEHDMHLLSSGQFIAASQVAPQRAVTASGAVQIHRKKRHRNRNHKHVTSCTSSSTITSTAEVS